MRPPTLTLRLGLAGLALASIGLVPAVAGAQSDTDRAGVSAAVTSTTGDTAGPGDLRPRVERACLRIPNLEIRTQRFIERLDGDESMRGSLAWLQIRVTRAQEDGREDLATVLENRLEVRTATRDVLDLRLAALTELKTRCGELGVEL